MQRQQQQLPLSRQQQRSAAGERRSQRRGGQLQEELRPEERTDGETGRHRADAGLRQSVELCLCFADVGLTEGLSESGAVILVGVHRLDGLPELLAASGTAYAAITVTGAFTIPRLSGATSCWRG